MPALPAGGHSRQDLLAAVALFLASAAFVLWQNSQVAVLWDLSYLLDTSWRIALGQIPYRDFPLVHPPLTFLTQAIIMRLAGRVYQWTVLYAAMVSGIGTVITWRIVHTILQPTGRLQEITSLLLAAPLVFLGIYGIYPHPIYDCDCAFAVLIALLLLQRFAGESENERTARRWLRALATGGAVVLPVFFKQNIGLPFLLVVAAGLLLLLVIRVVRRPQPTEDQEGIATRSLLQLLAGIAVAAIVGLMVIQVTAGLNKYVRWTVGFAAERRLPGFADMLGVYRQPSFVWTLPTLGLGLILLHTPLARRAWTRVLALLLMYAPFAGSIVFLFLNDDLDERGDNLLSLWPMLLIVAAASAVFALRKGITLQRLLPFFALAAIHGAFLSQQLWGSTYAVWPLLIVLVAQMAAELPASLTRVRLAWVAGVAFCFLLCGGLYAAGHDRLNYIQTPDEPIRKGSIPALYGMSIRGPYLGDFEELIRFADREIPVEDGILLLPGEEPFFYATGRTPHFPVQIFDRTTDPYSAAGLLDEARKRGIRWVVVKTRLQSDEDPLPERAMTLALVRREFTAYRTLAGYDVYRRR